LAASPFADAAREKQRQTLLAELEALLPNIEKIADVAYRREILDEPVPVDDKLFSLPRPRALSTLFSTKSKVRNRTSPAVKRWRRCSKNGAPALKR
jgi:hypothetical protein